MKRYPILAGKRNVGIAAKSNDRELAAPNDEARRGAVRSVVRMVLGAASARSGRSASFMVNLLVLWELLSFSVATYILNADFNGAMSTLGC